MSASVSLNRTNPGLALTPRPRVMYPVSPENVPMEIFAGIGVTTSSVVSLLIENRAYSVGEYAKQTLSLSRNTATRGE